MNKLIDADALCRVLDKRVGNPAGDAKLMEVNRVIMEMPWVDAIPMGFIHDMIDDNEPYTAKAAIAVKRAWEREKGGWKG